MSLNLLYSLFTSKSFIWHVHLNSRCIYIVTHNPLDVRVTVHGVAIIRTFTTSLHTPFTSSVPELGAILQPFVRGTKQPYSYTGSDDNDLLMSVYKAKRLQYCQNNLPCDNKNFITGFWRSLKGQFTQYMKMSLLICACRQVWVLFIEVLLQAVVPLIVTWGWLPKRVNPQRPLC